MMDAICREPYRLFFPLGVFAALWGVGLWLFYALGWIPTVTGFAHSLLQVVIYMNCFIIGFLLTALPRFTATAHARPWELGTFFMLMTAMAGAISWGQWILAEGSYLLWLIFLVRFIVVRVRHRRRDASAQPPVEMIWLPIGVVSGMVGTMLMMAGQLKWLPVWSLTIGKPMMLQGFLCCTVMGVASFLIPRLKGTHQRSTADEPPACTQSACGQGCSSSALSRKVRQSLVAGGIFLFSFVLEGLKWEAAGYGLRAAVMTIVFIQTKTLLYVPRRKDFYILLAWGAVWLVVIGYWLAAFLPAYQTAMLHLAFIGGFSLMTFSIGTMVIYSHAGEARRLQQFGWGLRIVMTALVLAVVKRMLSVLFPDQYFQFLGIASFFWCTAAVAWLVDVAPFLFKVPRDDEFEQMHQTAKWHGNAMKNPDIMAHGIDLHKMKRF